LLSGGIFLAVVPSLVVVIIVWRFVVEGIIVVGQRGKPVVPVWGI
jgi:hypothetical protein